MVRGSCWQEPRGTSQRRIWQREQHRFGRRLKPGPGGGGAPSAQRVQSTGPPGCRGTTAQARAGGRGGHLGIVAERQREISSGWPSQCCWAPECRSHHHQAAAQRSLGADGARWVSTPVRPAAGPATATLAPPPGEGQGAQRRIRNRPPCSPWAAAPVSGLQTKLVRPGSRCSPRRPSGAATQSPQAQGEALWGSDRHSDSALRPGLDEPAGVAPGGGAEGRSGKTGEKEPGRGSWGGLGWRPGQGREEPGGGPWGEAGSRHGWRRAHRTPWAQWHKLALTSSSGAPRPGLRWRVTAASNPGAAPGHLSSLLMVGGRQVTTGFAARAWPLQHPSVARTRRTPTPPTWAGESPVAAVKCLWWSLGGRGASPGLPLCCRRLSGRARSCGPLGPHSDFSPLSPCPGWSDACNQRTLAG